MNSGPRSPLIRAYAYDSHTMVPPFLFNSVIRRRETNSACGRNRNRAKALLDEDDETEDDLLELEDEEELERKVRMSAPTARWKDDRSGGGYPNLTDAACHRANVCETAIPPRVAGLFR